MGEGRPKRQARVANPPASPHMRRIFPVAGAAGWLLSSPVGDTEDMIPVWFGRETLPPGLPPSPGDFPLDAPVDALRHPAGEPPRPVAARPSRAEAAAAVRTLIAWAGDDPEREGLRETPDRVLRTYEEFYAGYRDDAARHLDRIFHDVGTYDDMVLVREIPFASHCEHHMVPFVGKAHLAYFPTDAVVGLSKLGRLVDVFGRRLQTQERMTGEILAALDEHLRPRGAAVMIEAEHMCMTIRGIGKNGATTVTTQFSGMFRDDPAEQARFLALVRNGS